MKANFTKRLFAYIVDVLIIFIISQFIIGLIPLSEKAKTANDKYLEIIEKIQNKKTTFSKSSKELQNIQYDFSKETVIHELVTIVVYISYFVIFAYKRNGQTLGKEWFNLRIKRKSKGKLTINNLVFRSLVLFNICFNIIQQILIVMLSKKNYIFTSNIIEIIKISVAITIILMIIIRKDGRGLHDLAGDTMVISEEEKE